MLYIPYILVAFNSDHIIVGPGAVMGSLGECLIGRSSWGWKRFMRSVAQSAG